MSFAPAPLKILIQSTAASSSMSVRGEVDLLTARQLRHAITDQLSHGPSPTLYLDLAGVSFMDSTGLKALLAGQRTARLLGGDLVLTAASPPVARLLQIIGVPLALDPKEAPADAASA
jgi:anti-sigma B factor antagonist